jgi:RNA polymerase sigma-70 factor (ECF subfamily)
MLPEDFRSFELLFHGLFEAWYHPLKVHAYHFTGDTASAEDIVQEAFVNLWKQRETFDFNRSVKTWLYQTVHNSCINYLKHRQVEDRFREQYQLKLQEAELHTEELFSQQLTNLTEQEINQRLKHAIDCLPDRSKQAFVLSRQSGLTNRQIANEMNISLKAVERNMTRALTFLREALGDLI